MNISEEYKKGVCQCRSCDNVFHKNEIEHKYIEILDQQCYSSVCPYCNSTCFGLIDYPMDESELIYKNEKFYGLSNEQKRYFEQYEYYKEIIDELFI